MDHLVLQRGSFSSDLLGSAAELVPLVGSFVLALVVVAFGAFVYRSLNGGIEWPEDTEEGDEDGVQRRHDDEWKYY
ncbi:hypothetical protein BRC90_08215 [Halobacteriales archaeon QS_4_69_34]|nr:MAG: hypothetical protein BRC90_08215 [Halobacteriales archaeon QS_4_69_34]